MRRISPTTFQIARRGTPREVNRQIALNLVRSKQPVSRAELARLMGVRRGAVTRLVDELLESGQVFEGAKGESRRGRKPRLLYIDTRRQCMVAVDITAAQESPSRMSFLTHGLRRYGREEFFMTCAIEGKGALAFVLSMTRWMLADPDKHLPTGDTVGRDADEKVPVQRVPNPTGDGTEVIRLDLP